QREETYRTNPAQFVVIPPQILAVVATFEGHIKRINDLDALVSNSGGHVDHAHGSVPAAVAVAAGKKSALHGESLSPKMMDEKWFAGGVRSSGGTDCRA
ncbi:MAG TPA: hypothetical protein VFL86_12635, partial [Burkholderiaceae bacterium]|nr:hypothetical protein [Burkholderiaceae bacterium]